ncbi:hypothetical protein STRIP9103_00165 [Streptomyces ipomoeae 91-03]|uniref:Uncharacterized protein n=1 Tax=Streptomyces ipomoeae 91-03 TaxID=698759 RepID=L1KLX2_9ACTN|nr:hypothetical protein STRIP9103_00165 [Streptomyces ipomoeae 91-03]
MRTWILQAGSENVAYRRTAGCAMKKLSAATTDPPTARGP